MYCLPCASVPTLDWLCWIPAALTLRKSHRSSNVGTLFFLKIPQQAVHCVALLIGALFMLLFSDVCDAGAATNCAGGK